MHTLRRKVEIPLYVLILAGVILIALLVVALQGDNTGSLAGTVAQQTSYNLDSSALVTKINASRTSALTVNGTLSTAAQNRANDYAAAGSSSSLAGASTYVSAAGYSASSVAGAVANSGTNLTADGLYSVWSSSSSLFSTTYTQAGVGMAYANSKYYYVIIVAKPTTTTGSAGTESSQQQDIVTLTNNLRTGLGKCSLTINSLLTTAAQTQADYMKSIDVYQHEGPNGTTVADRIDATGYADTYRGENVGAISSLNATTIFDAWKNSTDHYNNMISTSFTEIGVAWAGPSAAGKYYYAMVLATQGTGC